MTPDRDTDARDRDAPEQPEQPEHRGDRRRFLIWALMIGATTPQVVAERVVDELEQEGR